MQFNKNRTRHIIYNDDADQVTFNENYDYEITNEQSFLDVRTTPVFDTQVDTYSWCVGTGSDPPWGKIGGQLWPFLDSYDHATDIIVNACHARGLEVWGSLRMNDLHDSFQANYLEDTNDPIKAKHPEYLIAPENKNLPEELVDRFLWTAFNFAHPEVREHRLRFIEKNAMMHDFDGYELDFTRFLWYFPLGEERRHSYKMTDFIRKVREILNGIAQEREKPYTLVIHVPDSPGIALDLGIDVEALLNEKLVDVLIVGLGYIHYTMRLDEWKELGRSYGVPVYPSINAAVYTKKYIKLPEGQPKALEAIRATSAYWHQNGADGICLFNLFVWEDKNIGGYSREQVCLPLSEVGEPQTLVGKDKLYSIQASIDRASISHGSEAAFLPVALDTTEHILPLCMGPDAGEPGARFKIQALAKGGDDSTKVWMRLNHHLLEPKKEGDCWTVEAPQKIVRPGYNKLSVWNNIELDKTVNPLIIRRIFVAVGYT